MSAAPDWWRKPRRISVVVDNDSWVLPYAGQIVDQAVRDGDDGVLVREYAKVPQGAVAFYLGCVKITPPEVLARNRRNLVVHASDLPKGRGFSPLVWSVLAGENRVPVCLIEANDKVDEGPVVYKEWLSFEGHELNAEMRAAMGEMHVALCRRFLAESVPPAGVPQAGTPSYYPRRSAADSRLDPTKTLAEQFDLLRTVDNEKYPAFFEMRGHEFEIRIEKRVKPNKS